MIENIKPVYNVLNSTFHEFMNDDPNNGCFNSPGYVIIVYHGMRTYYVKRVANTGAYLLDKVMELATLDKRLPTCLRITESNALSLRQKHSIYYTSQSHPLTIHQIHEMMANSGYSHMMSRRGYNSAIPRFIMRMHLDNGMLVHMSIKEGEEYKDVAPRVIIMLRNLVENQKRNNSAAWSRIVYRYRILEVDQIVNRMSVSHTEKFPTDIPSNNLSHHVVRLNAQAMLEWGNTPHYMR